MFLGFGQKTRMVLLSDYAIRARNEGGIIVAKLTEIERIGFEKILVKDLRAINSKFMSQIKDFWALSRKEVMKTKGWDKLEKEKKDLKQQQEKARVRIHEIENTLNSEELAPEQIVELGGDVNEFGRYKGANFYGIPVTSQFEYDIVQYIQKRVNIEVPSKILRDICESSLRELAMSGTFEEAREAYKKFYSLNFRQYGVDIPPRLDDITKDNKLLEFAQKSMNLIEDKGGEKEEIKKIDTSQSTKETK